MNEELMRYFDGDDLAADVWANKYKIKDKKGKDLETTPDDMHRRMAIEFARADTKFLREVEKDHEGLSPFWREKLGRIILEDKSMEDVIYEYFKDFKYIVPQGSIMAMLGHPFKVGSLSNCFVIPGPEDSYGSLLKTDERMAQLMKRRAGVGTHLNNPRPTGSLVHNAAGTSTGIPSWMERYSNTTREVAQDGRRGALMLLLLCKHPDIFRFVTAKKDRTKVTGANISAMLTNEFLIAAEKDQDYFCTFPVSFPSDMLPAAESLEYNKLTDIAYNKWGAKVMKIKAKELLDLIMEMAWENAEPGVAFIDRIINFSPDGVYELFKAIASNPCGEQWLGPYDSCRLMAVNLFSVVTNPFTKKAQIDYHKLYEICYMQQRLADDLIELELEYVQRIIKKIKKDPEDAETKEVELRLWENVYRVAKAGRRTGCGFTALGDMLAALGIKYDSAEAVETIRRVCKTKMQAELDCTIDLAILRGPFEGWDKKKEYPNEGGSYEDIGANDFYTMILDEFPEQAIRMMKYGRRNVSWSTVAPTGTVSIMTQTTSGIEPLFLPYYMRRKKINPSEEGVRVDFTDQNGDTWQEFAVMHPKFKQWLKLMFDDVKVETLAKSDLDELFQKSPWYGSTANDINWEARVHIQAVIQRFTTNAISSTINLPSTATKEDVANIYWEAWRLGLKGVTVYRDGCRTGVLVNTETQKTDQFGFSEAPKRPKELEGVLYTATAKGVKYAVIIGLYKGNPYEVFAFENPEVDGHIHGKIVKVKKNHYRFESDGYTKDDIQLAAEHRDARLLTRWTSMLLRHGANPQFVIEQTEKSEVEITSFAKVICRILKKYIPEGAKSNVKCNDCGSTNVVYKEGCSSCLDCGNSKCG